MINYFVPISLLVLAGFSLGLLVGWLTWVSSKEPADREPAEQVTPDDTLEPAPSVPDRLANWSVIRDQAADWSPSDLPFWRMRELPVGRLSDAGVPSGNVDA